MVRLLRLLTRMGWPARLLTPFFGKFNPLHPQRRTDPYPLYQRLREAGPVVHSRLVGGWFVGGYAEGVEVLRAPGASCDRTKHPMFDRLNPGRWFSDEFQQMIFRNLLMLNPPDHTRLRGLVNKAFTPRMVEALKPRIETIVDELLDRVETRGQMDLVADFAVPLPLIVIAEMLGVEPKDHDDFKRWSDDVAVILDLFNAEQSFEQIQRSFDEMKDYFLQTFEDRRRNPRDDLISGLVNADDANRATDLELVSICMLVLAAGHETTTNLLGNGMLALFRNPGERKRLQDDLSLIEPAIEEFLRFDSPVQGTDRLLTEATRIGDVEIPAGDLAIVLIGSCNRDPRQFADPDRLDIGRAENRHLSFGMGNHFCLGATLARAEARIAVSRLLERFPDLTGPTEPEGWRASFVLRGPTALPVSLR